MNMRLTWNGVSVGLSLILGLFLMTSSASAEGCRYKKGRYELIENKEIGLMMLPPSVSSAVELARVRITLRGVTKIKGVLTASSGYSAVYFVPENKDLEEKNIVLSFFDKDMRASTDNVTYIVTQGFPGTLYYNARELWGELSLNGEAWRLVACR